MRKLRGGSGCLSDKSCWELQCSVAASVQRVVHAMTTLYGPLYVGMMWQHAEQVHRETTVLLPNELQLVTLAPGSYLCGLRRTAFPSTPPCPPADASVGSKWPGSPAPDFTTFFLGARPCRLRQASEDTLLSAAAQALAVVSSARTQSAACAAWAHIATGIRPGPSSIAVSKSKSQALVSDFGHNFAMTATGNALRWQRALEAAGQQRARVLLPASSVNSPTLLSLLIRWKRRDINASVEIIAACARAA